MKKTQKALSLVAFTGALLGTLGSAGSAQANELEKCAPPSAGLVADAKKSLQEYGEDKAALVDSLTNSCQVYGLLSLSLNDRALDEKTAFLPQIQTTEQRDAFVALGRAGRGTPELYQLATEVRTPRQAEAFVTLVERLHADIGKFQLVKKIENDTQAVEFIRLANSMEGLISGEDSRYEAIFQKELVSFADPRISDRAAAKELREVADASPMSFTQFWGSGGSAAK